MNMVIFRLCDFLGIKSRPISRKFKAPMRRRPILSIEQLESRDLLSGLLPAPSSALSQHPADNPALPAAFDVFNPPVANLAILSSAPQLATLTKQAKPDDSLAATGYQFSTFVGASAGQDTVFQAYGQTTAGNATLSNTAIQEINGDRAVATLDAGLPQNSMYLVWAENAAGASVPFAVNKTEAQWVGPNAASTGDTVSIYGQNLSSGGATPHSWIYLQPAQGQGQWISPTAVNPYKVDFVVPTNLAAGSYQLWVHNGHGGQYGWSSPVTLTVQAPIAYGNVVVKLSNFAGGLANTGVDATPAFQAALAAIGNNTGTIQLQAGTYDVSAAMPYITGGFNKGIYLEGAGKNATFIKALPGFSGQNLLIFGPDSKVSDLTMDTTGATLSSTNAVRCRNLENVAIIAHGYSDIAMNGLDYFYIKNSDLIGKGIFLSTSNQVIITGCNFYATDSTVSLVYIWSGTGISITNSTAQDFNVNSSNLADHGLGRFITGTGIWGTQSDVYIADNTTIHFAQPASKADLNIGEQIMWEGNQATQSSMVTSSTSSSVTLAALGGDFTGREAVIVSAKGIGQHRTILATDFATGGTTLTLDNPWNVIPDAVTRINIITTIKNVAIYHNTLQGNSNFAPYSGSVGIEAFEGGFDIFVDQNTLSLFRWGINDFAYTDPSLNGALPLFSTVIENNTIINCSAGIGSFDLGNSQGEAATHLGNIYRNNTMTGIQIAGWYVAGGYSTLGQTMDLDVFEHNSVTDAPAGIMIRNPSPAGPDYLVVYKNLFNRGAALAAGSQAIAPQAGFVTLLRGNTFLNYLLLQTPSGTITSLMPSFSWNAIPGADHYYIWIDDLTTGQSQQDTKVSANSWNTSTALTPSQSYRWWVEALDANGGVVSNWTAGQDFFVAGLGTPIPTNIGPTLYVNANSLMPKFTWSAVTGADSYDLWFNDVTTGQSQVLRQTTTNTFLIPQNSLTLGHQYRWWVRALNNSGNSGAWSNGASFSASLGSPTPVGPSGSLLNAEPNFTWGWVAGISFYDVWVNDTTTGQSQILRTPLTGSQVVISTSWTAPTALRPGDNYMWWVRAVSNNGAGSFWSSGTSFTVTLLSAPTQIAPIASVQNAGLIFQWSAVPGADYYDIWVSDLTTGTSQIVRNAHVKATSLPTSSLTAGHTYRWWVRALSYNGDYSGWSSSVDFIDS